MTRFDEGGVMIRSRRDDRSWCESCLVGDFTNCEKEVEWRSSANQLSIVSGENPEPHQEPHLKSDPGKKSLIFSLRFSIRNFFSSRISMRISMRSCPRSRFLMRFLMMFLTWFSTKNLSVRARSK